MFFFVILIIVYVCFTYYKAAYITNSLYETEAKLRNLTICLHDCDVKHNNEMYYLRDIEYVLRSSSTNKFRHIPMMEIFICEIDLQIGSLKPGFFEHSYNGTASKCEGWGPYGIERFYYCQNYFY